MSSVPEESSDIGLILHCLVEQVNKTVFVIVYAKRDLCSAYSVNYKNFQYVQWKCNACIEMNGN